MRQRAVIFDFGGVLFKTTDRTPRYQWDAKLNLPQGTVERVVHNATSWKAAQRNDIPLSAYWQDVAQQLNIPLETASGTLLQDFYAGDQLDNDMVDWIQARRAEGVTIALLSNDHADLLRPRMARLGITHLFEPLVISSDIGVMKPDPRAYHAVLDQLQRPPDEAIFIDDMRINIDAANAIGIHGIHYTAGMDLDAAIRPLLAL